MQIALLFVFKPSLSFCAYLFEGLVVFYLMSSGNQKKHSQHPLRKKILGVVLKGILVILLLESIVYFGSNLFLAGIARQKLNESSDGVYEIGFNRFNLSLLRRGFFLDGIVMKPIHPENSKVDQTLFEFTLDEISFSGLWYDFSENEFSVSKIHLDNPNLQLFNLDSSKVHSTTESPRESAIKILESEIRKSIRRLSLRGFYVDLIEIDHANFFFFNFLSQGELSAKNTSIRIYDLDWTTTEDWDTPFNAKGIDFDLDQATFPLPDGVHTVGSEKVHISSLEKSVEILGFSLTPNLKADSRSYYQVNLERLRLGNADLDKAFMTSELEADELIMDRPVIKVIKSDFAQSDTIASGDLNDFIQGKLNSISIKELSVNDAQFLKENRGDSLKNRIQLDDLDFKMVGFYLGQDQSRKSNQFFYGDEASMEITRSKLFLGDGIHILEGNKISVSSFKDELVVRDLKVYPTNDPLLIRSAKNLVTISLPELSLLDVDLKKLYQTDLLEVDRLIISQPDIEITEQVATEQEITREPFSQLIAGFLDGVAIRDFQVIDGKVFFKDNKGQRSNNIGFEKFSLKLDELELNPDPFLPLQDQFFVKDLFLSLNEYKLKLKDNLHLIFANQLTIDSKRKLLEVKGLSIKPENQDQIQALLDTYGKTFAVEFSIPLFQAKGLDVKEAFFNHRLLIDEMLLPSPSFLISSYRSKENKNPENNQATAEEVKNLLLGYFDAIQINSIDLSQTKIKYESFIENKRSRFQEDELSFKLKNFALGLEDSLMGDKTLFSDEVDLIFNNYSFTLAGGKYIAETDYLNYNSKTKTIDFEGLVLAPAPGIKSKLALALSLPMVRLEGVDIEEFIFESNLNLEKLEIDQGEVEFGIDREIEPLRKTRPSKTPSSRKTLEVLKIDTVSVLNSLLKLNYFGSNHSNQSIKTGFDLLISDFYLDTLGVEAEDVTEMYGSANLDLKDFVFALPDSVHTLQFSTLRFGDKIDDLIFSHLRITPRDHFGTSGNPVIEAKIDQLMVRKNKIQEMFDSKQLDLSQIRFINPVFKIYLDSAGLDSEKTVVALQEGGKLIQSIFLNEVSLENGNIQFHSKGKGPISNMNFPKIDVRLGDLGIDILSQNQLPPVADLVKKVRDFRLEGYQFYTADSLYHAKLGKLTFTDGDLWIDDISFRPAIGTYAYLRKFPFQKDAVTATATRIQVRGMDPVSYFERGLLKADDLILEGVNLDLFRDKRIPMDSNSYKPMPQVLMEHAKIDADIFSVRVRDSRIRYFEFAKEGTMPGMISFDSVRMDMAPFFLRKDENVYPVQKARMGIQARLMNKTPIQVDGVLHFEEPYPMDLSFGSGTFDFMDVSDFLSKTVFVRAEKGRSTAGEWDFMLDEESALGSMKFAYKDLKLQFLDTLTLEAGKGKLKAYSIGANFLIKNSNPRSGSSNILKRQIYLKRDKRKFIFSAWWKATLSGLRATVGLGRPKIPKEASKKGN